MGTRSMTFVKDEYGNEVLAMYRQMDGYPSGHGLDLAEFLSDIAVVNGISLAEERHVANGAGCLAAQIVAHFKHGAGGIYLHPQGEIGQGIEYVYYVRTQGPGDDIIIEANAYHGYEHLRKKRMEPLFQGNPQAFIEWVTKERNHE